MGFNFKNMDWKTILQFVEVLITMIQAKSGEGAPSAASRGMSGDGSQALQNATVKQAEALRDLVSAHAGESGQEQEEQQPQQPQQDQGQKAKPQAAAQEETGSESSLI
jgi:hypothetical protein